MINKTISLFDRSLFFIEKFIRWVIVFSVGSLVIVMISNIFLRSIFNASIQGADEFALFMLVWITFLGASISIKHNNLPAITFIKEKFSERIQFILFIFTQIVILVFCLIILYYAFNWITSSNVMNRVSASMRVPMWLPYSILPITMFVNILFAVQNIIQSRKRPNLEKGSD